MRFFKVYQLGEIIGLESTTLIREFARVGFKSIDHFRFEIASRATVDRSFISGIANHAAFQESSPAALLSTAKTKNLKATNR